MHVCMDLLWPSLWLLWMPPSCRCMPSHSLALLDMTTSNRIPPKHAEGRCPPAALTVLTMKTLALLLSIACCSDDELLGLSISKIAPRKPVSSSSVLVPSSLGTSLSSSSSS